MRRLKKKAELNLSFGMIFSIILIIVFIAFGFYAIKKFIDLQDNVKIQNFLRDLQDDVDNMWKSSQGSTEVSYPLPTKISAVCFRDDEIRNLEFVSSSPVNGKLISNIDITKITEEESLYCIQTLKGKINLKMIKEFGEVLVTIER